MSFYLLENRHGSFNIDDSSAYGFPFDGGNIGSPDIKKVFLESWKRGLSPLASQSYHNRAASFQIRITGADMNELIENYNLIAEFCSEANRYSEDPETGSRGFFVVSQDSMGDPMVFDVITADLKADNISQVALLNPVPMIIDAQLELSLAPFVRTQIAEELISQTLKVGGGAGSSTTTEISYVQPKIQGQLPSRPLLRMAMADTSTYRGAVIGRKSKGLHDVPTVLQFTNSILSPLYSCAIVATTFAASTQSVAGASNGDVTRMTAGASTATGDVTATYTLLRPRKHLQGRYRVYLRIDAYTVNNIADFVGATLAYDHPDGTVTLDPRTPGAVASLSDAILEIGEMEIIHDERVFGASNFTFTVKFEVDLSGSATNLTADIDCVYLVPIDEALIDVEFSSALYLLGIDKLDKRLFALNSSGQQITGVSRVTNTPFELSNESDHMWVILPLPGARQTGSDNGYTGYYWTAQDLADTFLFSVTYFPRFWSYR